MAVLESNCRRPHYAYKMKAYWPGSRHKHPNRKHGYAKIAKGKAMHGIRTTDSGQWTTDSGQTDNDNDSCVYVTDKQTKLRAKYESAHTTAQNHLKAIISGKHEDGRRLGSVVLGMGHSVLEARRTMNQFTVRNKAAITSEPSERQRQRRETKRQL